MRPRPALFLIPLVAFGMMMAVTSKHGMGITVDSVRYMAMAKHIAADRGVAMYNRTTGGESRPVINHPPLWPALLAIPCRLNIDLETSTWVLMNVLLAMNLLLSGYLVYLFTRNVFFAAASQALFVFDRHLLSYHCYVLTEPLFFVWTQAAAVFLWCYLTEKKRRWLFGASAMIAAASLTRYVGLAYMVAMGLCLVLLDTRRLRERFGSSLVFGTLASLPLLLWFLRHFALTGEHFDRVVGGVTPQTSVHPASMLRSTAEAFLYYPVAADGFGPGAIFGTIPALLFLGAGFAFFRVRGKSAGASDPTLPLMLLVFAITYGVGLYGMWSWRSVEALPDPIRFMTPVYLHLWGILAMAAFWVSRRRGWLKACVAVWVLWLFLSGPGLAEWARTGWNDGLYGRTDVLSWSFVNRIPWFPAGV